MSIRCSGSVFKIPYCDVWTATLLYPYDTSTIVDATIRRTEHECRAFRIVGDSLKFLFLKIPRTYPDSDLKVALREIVDIGLTTRFSYGQGKIGYQEFAFLGFKESGIRNGHIILLLKTVDHVGEKLLSVASLLQSFGNLQDVYREYGPGKYTARLSLSFSATVESINPPNSQVVKIPDSKAENGVFTTDGCGIIRESYAKEIRSRHNFDSGTCVFQIRRGGIKGLLVAYPDDIFDEICRKNGIAIPRIYKIAYRKSMLKYTDGPTRIEITNISKPRKSARLNRSIIVILVNLAGQYGGIGELLRALRELMKLQLRRIEMIAYDRQEALTYIDGDLDAEGDGRLQDLYEMLLAGHSLNDAYIRSRLRDCQRIQCGRLRKNLNIMVHKSCRVYGVVDELGVLAEDEVFLQLPEREGILVSDVLIARDPMHRPSDVRVMKATSKPELDFLTNCIVFPRSGKYSIPGSMAGGDLDGDEYFVSWEPAILPRGTEWPIQVTVETETPKIDRSRRALNEALVDLFVEQRYSEIMRQASIEWQSVVESYFPQMAGAEYPMKLAGIIEEALDILKSGGSYEALNARYRDTLSDYDLHRNYVRQQPSKLHFLRKMIPSIDEDKDTHYKIDPDLNLRAEGSADWDEYYEQGEIIIRDFNRGLADAMINDYITKKDGAPHHRREDDSIYVEDYCTRFTDKYFPRTDDSIMSKAARGSYLRASAWYCVGYLSDRPAFAWVGARFLNSIKSFKAYQGRPGLSIGPLKSLAVTEAQLEDQYRELSLYSKHIGGTRPSSKPMLCNAIRIRRVEIIDV